jgi:hypothetical protein
MFTFFSAMLLVFATMSRHDIVNRYFEKDNHWQVFNLTYNATQVAHVGQTWRISSAIVAGQAFLTYFIMLGIIVPYKICTVRNSPTRIEPRKIYAVLGTLSFFMVLIMVWVVFQQPSSVYPLQDMKAPWILSASGDEWLDWKRGYKGRREGGHHLRVECPDGSWKPTDLYGRVYREFVIEDPGLLPPWPHCADYYSEPRSTLFRMCCAERTILQAYDPQPVFDTSQKIFLGFYLFYLCGNLLICLGLASFICHERSRAVDSSSLSRLTTSSTHVHFADTFQPLQNSLV